MSSLAPEGLPLPSSAPAGPGRESAPADGDDGAFSAFDGGLLSLSGLDGGGLDDALNDLPAPGLAERIDRRGGAAGAGAPPSIGRPVPRLLPVDDAPLDLFAPPRDVPAEAAVELAPDELAHRARKRPSAPPGAEPPSLPALPRRSSPSPVPASLISRTSSPALPVSLAPARAANGEPVTSAAGPAGTAAPASPAIVVSPATGAAPAPGLLRRLVQTQRARLATGVFLAIVVGFLPAGVVGSLQQQRAFHAIDARVAAVQAAVDSPESYDALDAFRAEQLAAKRSARRFAMVTAMLLWAAAGGGLAYLWFRRVPWSHPGRGGRRP